MENDDKILSTACPFRNNFRKLNISEKKPPTEGTGFKNYGSYQLTPGKCWWTLKMQNGKEYYFAAGGILICDKQIVHNSNIKPTPNNGK